MTQATQPTDPRPASPVGGEASHQWVCKCCTTEFQSAQSEHLTDPFGGHAGAACPTCKAGGQFTYLVGFHMGDPCFHCGKPHDEVEPGPCPMKSEAALSAPSVTAKESGSMTRGPSGSAERSASGVRVDEDPQAVHVVWMDKRNQTGGRSTVITDSSRIREYEAEGYRVSENSPWKPDAPSVTREASGDFEEAVRLAEIGEYLYDRAYSYGDGQTEPREFGIQWDWQQSKPGEYGQGMLLKEANDWHEQMAADGVVTQARKLRAILANAAPVSAHEGGSREIWGGGDVIATVDPSRWDHPDAPQLAYAYGREDALAALSPTALEQGEADEDAPLRAALIKIAGLNDLEGVPDDEVESAACHALHECELIARDALEGLPLYAALEQGSGAFPAKKPVIPTEREDGAVVALPRYVIVPLSCAPYPKTFLDDVNGYATGGSTRCLEGIQGEGAWVAALPETSQPGMDTPEGVGMNPEKVLEERCARMEAVKPFVASQADLERVANRLERESKISSWVQESEDFALGAKVVRKAIGATS